MSDAALSAQSRLGLSPQGTETGMWAAAIYAAAFFPALALIAVVWIQPFVPPAELLRDPLAVAELSKDCCHAYYGFVSNLGVLVWWSAASILLFAAALIIRRAGSGAPLAFLMIAGLFTGWLTLDDFFLVHEDVLPKLGVDQMMVYGAYAVFALLYLYVCFRQRQFLRLPLLFASLGLLGFSVMIDQLVHSDSATRILIEDGAKLMGITSWFVFHFEAAYRIVCLSPTRPSAVENS